MNLVELCGQVSLVARGAGALICSQEHIDVYEKDGRANFVTSMDLASQEYIISHLKELLPDSNFFAEESEKNQMKPGYNWIIDPIDGTTNFMLGFNHSCISIGLVKDGEGVLGVVYDPFLDELYTAVKGAGAFLNGKPIHASDRPRENSIVVFGTSFYNRDLSDLTMNSLRVIFEKCGDLRRTGSAALDLCYVAAGKCDAYYELRIQPWDYAAGLVIAREAGAVVAGLRDMPLDFVSPVGVVCGSVELCELIDSVVKEEAKLLGLY